MLEISNVQTQNIQLQKQSKMRLLCAKLSLEALLVHINSIYIKIQSLQRFTQNI